MLMSISDHYLWHRHRHSDVHVQVQNATMAEAEHRAFVVLGSSAFIPLLYGIQLFGLKYMLRHSGMKWYLPELGCYCAGVTFYGVSLPLTAPFPSTHLNKTSRLTDNCRPELPSALLRADSTYGALPIRSSMSPFCAPYTSIRSY